MSDFVSKLKSGALPESEELSEFLSVGAEERAELIAAAGEVRDKVFGRKIYIRALIEYTNVCRNNCLYCGIRRSADVARYTLDGAEILSAVASAHASGIRTAVLQGGENPAFDEKLIGVIRGIKKAFPDTAVTLSAGERDKAVYAEFRKAGADRYLLRHETACEKRYALMHPPEMKWQNRMRCLEDLKSLGFQTGIGFMVGAPFETPETLWEELRFAVEFKPQMLGIGPFVPASGTPFSGEPSGSAGLTVTLLAMFRLLLPNVLLPATTALATLDENMRFSALDAGANVIMPNFTPVSGRQKYRIYDGKAGASGEASENFEILKKQLNEKGYVPALGERGDYIER